VPEIIMNGSGRKEFAESAEYPGSTGTAQSLQQDSKAQRPLALSVPELPPIHPTALPAAASPAPESPAAEPSAPEPLPPWRDSFDELQAAIAAPRVKTSPATRTKCVLPGQFGQRGCLSFMVCAPAQDPHGSR
jgi:hypothetical protein